MASVLAWAQAQPLTRAHCQVELICNRQVAVPGEEIWLGVRLAPEKGWHTYWKNPGEAGFPTEVHWELPVWSPKEQLHWPLPHHFEAAGIQSYGYSQAHVLLRRWKIPEDQKSPVIARVKVAWLACNQDQCVPGEGTLQLSLPLGKEPQASLWSQEMARQIYPQTAELKVERTPQGFALGIPGSGPAHFYPEEPLQIRDSAPQIQKDGRLYIEAPQPDNALKGVLVVGEKGYLVEFVAKETP